MAVRVRLSDGITILVSADLDTFSKAYEQALADGRLLEVENGHGKKRIVNPRQVLYFEEAEHDAPEAEAASSSLQQSA
jgi:hypothetical protein